MASDGVTTYMAGENRAPDLLTRLASGVPCERCVRRRADSVWLDTGGGLAFVHGGGALWCSVCVLEAQVAHVETLAATLPDLRARLAEARERNP